ncbi:GntR family transcriptional regulator [Nakamurella flavida]|uniref:GntR family transcriptional regulator n=1 Tax=Nakamurella flavida TaxID=363630 RepID=A0A938YGP9_9ACTN|nr:GntR family transcriptional regulator [Nakamurella flavida]MBM9477366.1 GntR family transcriptional regulator [Nakamurella flavida]MDP9777298.1 DNA-binding GntR family transcriptional regulator [Nakamurella flavida]
MQESRSSRQSTVVDGIRRRIISGEMSSGTALSEVSLAQDFGVSRTPVREALKQLQAEGLVEVRPRVGTFVSTPTRTEIIELFQVKEVLEGAAARFLAARGEVAELDALRHNVARSDLALERDDVETYTELVAEFHDLIVLGAGNAKLRAHHTTLMNQLAYPRLISTSLSTPGRFAESENEHRRLLEVIESRDGASAERLMRNHVRASQEALVESMFADHDERPGSDA